MRVIQQQCIFFIINVQNSPSNKSKMNSSMKSLEKPQNLIQLETSFWLKVLQQIRKKFKGVKSNISMKPKLLISYKEISSMSFFKRSKMVKNYKCFFLF